MRRLLPALAAVPLAYLLAEVATPLGTGAVLALIVLSALILVMLANAAARPAANTDKALPRLLAWLDFAPRTPGAAGDAEGLRSTAYSGVTWPAGILGLFGPRHARQARRDIDRIRDELIALQARAVDARAREVASLEQAVGVMRREIAQLKEREQAAPGESLPLFGTRLGRFHPEATSAPLVLAPSSPPPLAAASRLRNMALLLSVSHRHDYFAARPVESVKAPLGAAADALASVEFEEALVSRQGGGFEVSAHRLHPMFVVYVVRVAGRSLFTTDSNEVMRWIDSSEATEEASRQISLFAFKQAESSGWPW